MDTPEDDDLEDCWESIKRIPCFRPTPATLKGKRLDGFLLEIRTEEDRTALTMVPYATWTNDGVDIRAESGDTTWRGEIVTLKEVVIVEISDPERRPLHRADLSESVSLYSGDSFKLTVHVDNPQTFL